ncbi:hypothetical protein BGZ63DRAFT_420707 [Mariannaea sp. PMI_226]|nr:hypothetical protein BGZ63DRAFT_420707 [Mariannaea sp. PMI_226]
MPETRNGLRSRNVVQVTASNHEELERSRGPPHSANSLQDQYHWFQGAFDALERRAEQDRQTTKQMLRNVLLEVGEYFIQRGDQLGDRIVSTISGTHLHLKQQLDEALQQKGEAQNIIVHLEQQLDKVQGQLENARKERDAQRRIAEGGNLANSTKATGEAIISTWKQLDYNIKSLANFIAKEQLKQPELEQLDNHASEIFLAMTKNWRTHLNNEDTRDFLFQGYLWHKVHYIILSTTRTTWLRNNNGPLKQIKNSLIGTRAIRSRFLFRILRDGQLRVQLSFIVSWIMTESLNHVITREVKHLVSLGENSTSSNRREKKIWDELKTIFECALNLDDMLTSSKAIFTIRWQDACGIRGGKRLFDPDTMEAIGWVKPLGRRSNIQFLTSPTLYKRGNADGQHYDSCVVLIKASVICD